TRVIGPTQSMRSHLVSPFDRAAALGLVKAWSDVALLPDLGPVFARAVDHNHPFTSWGGLTQSLAATLHDHWPFGAEAFTTLPNVRDAFRLGVLAALSGRPSVVAAETPG